MVTRSVNDSQQCNSSKPNSMESRGVLKQSIEPMILWYYAASSILSIWFVERCDIIMNHSQYSVRIHVFWFYFSFHIDTVIFFSVLQHSLCVCVCLNARVQLTSNPGSRKVYCFFNNTHQTPIKLHTMHALMHARMRTMHALMHTQAHTRQQCETESSPSAIRLLGGRQLFTSSNESCRLS